MTIKDKTGSLKIKGEMMGQTDQSFDMKVDQQRKLFNLKQVKAKRLESAKYLEMCSHGYLVKRVQVMKPLWKCSKNAKFKRTK